MLRLNSKSAVTSQYGTIAISYRPPSRQCRELARFRIAENVPSMEAGMHTAVDDIGIHLTILHRMSVARDKLRTIRAKKRALRNAKDKAYAEFIAKRDGKTVETADVVEEKEQTEVMVDVDLVQPEVQVEEVKTVRQKILVPKGQLARQLEKKKSRRLAKSSAPSALVPGEGRSMGMELDS